MHDRPYALRSLISHYSWSLKWNRVWLACRKWGLSDGICACVGAIEGEELRHEVDRLLLEHRQCVGAKRRYPITTPTSNATPTPQTRPTVFVPTPLHFSLRVTGAEWLILSRLKQNGESVKFSSQRFSHLKEIFSFQRFSRPIGTFLAVCGLSPHKNMPQTAKKVSMRVEKSPGREKISLEKENLSGENHGFAVLFWPRQYRISMRTYHDKNFLVFIC